MKNFVESVLCRWLKIEYQSIANKSQFIIGTLEADDDLVKDTIRCLDYITTSKIDNYQNYTITLIALMWEYINKNKYDIRSFALKVLSRIGYPTSAIIIDDGFSEENKFFRPTSFLDMLALTVEHQKSEVVINKQSFLLTEFQKQIWDAMNQYKLIGISAPTSAGKSFVLLLKTIERIIHGRLDVVYIVPTLSLLNQVTKDYNKMLKKLGVENCKIVNGFIPNVDSDFTNIYILTQEKALAAFSNEEPAFTKNLILIVDEIQNIERIYHPNDLRAKILYDTLIEFRQKDNIEQIIISGPRIEGIDSLASQLFGKAAIEIKTGISPVLNLTYSISKNRNKYYFKQYCSLLQQPFSMEIQNTSFLAGYGQKLYTKEYMDCLKAFVKNIGEGNQNIIFAPTSNTAKNLALVLSENNAPCNSDALNMLIKYYAKSVNKNYAMCNTLKNGVAYHHGKLPMHVRRTLEQAISDKMIKNVVCTTTLMQGVNMPAQNVIVRNPHLYIRKSSNSVELSSYEMANLRGRAGRLLKDFVGRTFVLDESGFSDLAEYDQLDLFEDTMIEIPVGYGEKYKEFKEDINDALFNNISVDLDMSQYGYLVSYIRQTVLRYGTAANEKMRQVGIPYTKEQVAAMMYKLNNLTVPKAVCYKNRYWDPLVLNTIYNEFTITNLPNTPTEKGARAQLDEMLKFLRDNISTRPMYIRHIPEKYQAGVGRSILCSACMDWSCEKTLATILSGDRYNGEDATEQIDGMIDLLQKTVSFDVPLLLKPIFDMHNPTSIFLLSMQAGAYKPFTRRMIELGVPRETAIFLNSSVFNKKKYDSASDLELENIIRNEIQKIYSNLPYWIQVQLSFMM